MISQYKSCLIRESLLEETSWWHFWGPVFRYAGTGAYLVKVSSIPEILAHLRQQPIDDIDGMLLSEESK